MPKNLEQIVQSMIDAGESEEDIAGVIKHYNSNVVQQNEPDTFMGGVRKSLTSGEAGNASLQGLLGYAKGAIADLPGGIINAAKFASGMVMDPFGTSGDAIKAIPGALRDVANTASQAGSNPEAFGRLMGQTTGQPLVTEGLAKGIPRVVSAMRKPAATGIETAGRIMKEHQPISGTLPRVAEPRILRTAERKLGGAVENAGRNMRPQPPAAPTPAPYDIANYRGLFREHGTPALDTGPTQNVNPNVSSNIPQLDSRISGLPPEIDLPLNTGPSSPIVNQAAGGSRFFDDLSMQAQRYGMPVDQYINSLRRGGGEGFVMPSAELPRVR